MLSADATPLKAAPTINEPQTPTQAYANIYFTINLTINHPNTNTRLKNATVEISSSIRLCWDQKLGFFLYEDPNGYCTMDPVQSSATPVNSTALKLSFCLKLDWRTPTGYIHVIPTGTAVFSMDGSSARFAGKHAFIFNNELSLNLNVFNGSRLDVSNTVFTGTLSYKNTSLPPGNGNSALKLNGATYVTCGGNPALFWRDAGSVAFWAKIEPQGRWQHIIDKRGYGLSTDNQGYAFGVTHDNLLYVCVTTNNGSYTAFGKRPVDGEWHFYAATWENNELKLYVDSVQNSAAVRTKGKITVGENYPLYVGLRQPGYGFTYGVIDELHIYNKALSSSTVSILYRDGCRSNDGLVLYLSFDGDLTDTSIVANQCVLYPSGWAWTEGYARVNVFVELNSTVRIVPVLVNSTSGCFNLFMVNQESAGSYLYSVYTSSKEAVTVAFLADRLKIVEGGISAASTLINEPQIVWFRAVYELDNAPFNADCGVLFVNDYAIRWSGFEQRWEYLFDPVVSGEVTFRVSGYVDWRFGLSSLNDLAGSQKITIYERTYPFSWINSLTLLLVVLLMAKLAVKRRSMANNQC